MTASYVDTNVLVYAFGDAGHPMRLRARTALESAADAGDVVTSVLAIDEFLGARRRESGFEVAIEDTRHLLKAPVLRILPLDVGHAHAAVDLVERHRLRPRDAMHVALSRAVGCSRFLSDDADFDVVPGLVRMAP